jgi:4-hydroxy 2-oxovalerate aldolase
MIRIADVCLRDGSHAVHHQLTPEQVTEVARRLDEAGVYLVEVGHGDGLAGSSAHFGRGAHSDAELIGAAAGVVRRAKLAVSVQPGVATMDDMRAARELGANVFKIATHCTEADIGIQHLGLARDLGCEGCGGLMMTHMTEPEPLAEQARIMADAGAQVIYVADSAGAMTPDQVRARVAAVRAAIPDEVGVAIHAHNNLSLAVANSVAAVEEGASLVDASLAGFGAAAGNTQLEAIVAVLHRLGYETGVDLWLAQDAAEEVVRPLMPPGVAMVNRTTLALGYAGVYSSFLEHTRRIAANYGVDPRDVLVELGRRRVVAGQEDMIIAVAAELAGVAQAR